MPTMGNGALACWGGVFGETALAGSLCRGFDADFLFMVLFFAPRSILSYGFRLNTGIIRLLLPSVHRVKPYRSENTR